MKKGRELEGPEVDFQAVGGKFAVDFEWDPDKANANLRKHAVSFFDATAVFGDTLSSTVPDPDGSVGEHRYLIFGQTRRGAHLVVSFTDRDDKIRLISARPMTARERAAYEGR